MGDARRNLDRVVSEQFLDSVVASGDVLYVYRIQPDTAFEFLSDSIVGHVGYTAKELIDDPGLMASLADPRDAEALAALLAAPPGESLSAELRWRHRDGHVLWTQHRVRKRVRPDGSVVMEGASRDVTALHDMLEALREQEEQYRLLAENAADVVTRTSVDGRVEWVSPSIRTVLGWTPEELVGRQVADLIHPDDALAHRDVAEAVAAGRAAAYRVRLRARNGDYRWLAVSLRPLFGRDGEVIGRVVATRDVHDEVQARAELAASQQLWESAFDAAGIGTAMVGLDGRFQSVNPALCRLLGHDEEWFLGRSTLECVHPDDRPLVGVDRQRLVDGESPAVTRELRLLHADGSPVWVRRIGLVVRDPSGAPERLMLQFEDTTVAHEADARRAEADRRYRLVAENTSDVVFSTDATGLLDWVSPSALDVLGHHPEHLVGRRLADLVHPDDRSLVLAVSVSGSGSHIGHEARFLAPDGSYRWMSVVVGAILDENGVLVGRAGGIRDIQAEHDSRALLRGTERRYRLLAENATDVVYETDADGVMTWVSEGVERLLGWTSAEWVGRHGRDFTAPEDLELVDRATVEVLAGQRDSLRFRLLTRSGSTRWVEATVHAVHGDRGELVGFVGGWRDVQAEHEAHESLRASERMLRAAIDHAPIAMALVAPEGRWLRANAAMCDLLGRPEEELLSLTWQDITHPDDLASNRELLRSLLAGERDGFRVRKSYLRANGDAVLADLSASAVRDEDGQVLFMVAQVVPVEPAGD